LRIQEINQKGKIIAIISVEQCKRRRKRRRKRSVDRPLDLAGDVPDGHLPLVPGVQEGAVDGQHRVPGLRPECREDVVDHRVLRGEVRSGGLQSYVTT